MTSARHVQDELAVADVLLRDGRIAQLRPVVPQDEAALRSLHAAISARTRWLRYFTVSEGPGQWYVEHLLQPDRPGAAVAALVDGNLVAVGDFVPEPADPTLAEVSLLVADGHQAEGLGALLLEQLAVLAHRQGVRAFVAEVLAENTGMRHLLADSGFSTRASTSWGVQRLHIDLADTQAWEAAVERRAEVAERASLRPVLAPAVIAVVGPGGPGSVTDRVAAALRADGVVLHRLEDPAGLGGLVPSPELVVVAVPGAQLLGAAEAAASAGARGLLVLSGVGGSAPDRTARDLLHVCRGAGMRLVGPGSLGVVSTDPSAPLTATAVDVRPRTGRVALVSQSAAAGVAAVRHLTRCGAGLSAFVATGDRLDVSSNDLLTFFGGDPRTEVVVLQVESLGNPRSFVHLAAAVGRRTPVVVVGDGRSSSPGGTGTSRTAAGATPERVTEALLRAAGVLRADDLAELAALLRTLDAGLLPRGRRLAVVDTAGGRGLLAADACRRAGLEPAALSPSTRERLRAAVATGPGTSAPPGAFEQALAAVLADPGADAVLAVCTPEAHEQAQAYASAVLRAAATAPDVLLLAAFPGVEPPLLRRSTAPFRTVPVFELPEPAVRALGAVAAYAAWRTAPAPVAAARRRPDAAERAAAVLRGGPSDEGEVEPSAVATVLEAYGIPGAPPTGADPGPLGEGFALLAGVVVDPVAGPVVLVGAGGGLADVWDDVVVRVPPRSREQALEQVGALRCAPVLQGDRGRPPLDVDAVADVLLALGHLAADLPDLAELELDPLLVLPRGVRCLDARLRLAAPSAPPLLARALRPAPEGRRASGPRPQRPARP